MRPLRSLSFRADETYVRQTESASETTKAALQKHSGIQWRHLCDCLYLLTVRAVRAMVWLSPLFQRHPPDATADTDVRRPSHEIMERAYDSFSEHCTGVQHHCRGCPTSIVNSGRSADRLVNPVSDLHVAAAAANVHLLDAGLCWQCIAPLLMGPQ